MRAERHPGTPRPPAITRRFAALAIVAVLAGLALAACGSDDSGDAAATATAAEAHFPLTVTHAFGTTTVDAPPTRVVTVGVSEQDTVLALGIKPVGVTEWYGEQPYATWPWAQEALGDAKPVVLDTSDGFQYERIAALRPDLIIGTNAGMDAAAYEKLSAIAPTVAHAKGFESDYFPPWDGEALRIGQALGKEAEVKELIADVKQQFAQAAADHPEFAGTKAIFLQNAIYDGNAIAYQDGLSTAFLTDLGFTIPASLDQYATEGGQAYIPVERLGVLDTGDVLLWATEKPSDRAALEKVPLYPGLEAVKNGTQVFTDGTTAGAIYFTSVLSLPYVLDRLVPAMASALAGDGPATIE